LLRTNFGSEIALGINTLTNLKDPAPDNTLGIWLVRQAQLQWLTGKVSDPLVIDLGDNDFLWSNTTDGAHPTDPTDMELMGEISALSVLKFRGIAPYSGVGPTIVSATRARAIIDVTLAHNGGTNLLKPNAGNVSGFDVTLASNNFTAITSPVSVDTIGNKITWTGHPLNNADPVIINATTTEPGGLTAGTIYFVVNKTANDFQVAAIVGGGAITITTAGSGVVVSSNRDLLTISSTVILNPTTVRITLASVPSGPVAVNYVWGTPGRHTYDPDASLDTSSRSAMTQRIPPAQGNMLSDNYSMAYSNTHVLGRPVRFLAAPIISN
jgi:hypothetical protein